MYQTDYEPTDTASVLTTGAIGKLAAATANLRVETTDLNERLAKYRAAFDETLDDLERRIASVEAEVKAQIAGAGGETLAERLARLNPRR
jgi:hypothetical protein